MPIAKLQFIVAKLQKNIYLRLNFREHPHKTELTSPLSICTQEACYHIF